MVGKEEFYEVLLFVVCGFFDVEVMLVEECLVFVKEFVGEFEEWGYDWRLFLFIVVG